ncbi:hypothetical protein SPAN111604_00040 [Sphingomonas antarctica]
MRWVWRLLAMLVMACGCAPAAAQPLVRAPFIRCADQPDSRCPVAKGDQAWVVLTAPEQLADLPSGWQLLVDQTRFSRITIEVQTGDAIYRIERGQKDLAANWSLGNNLRFDIPIEGREVRAVRIGFDRPGDLHLMRTIKAASPEALNDYESAWQFTVALVAGLMICALIYSVFLLSWLRTNFQRWYLIWVGGALTYMLLWSGVAYYAWPGLVGNATVRIDALLAGVLVGVGTLFFYALLEDEAQQPRMARIGRMCAWAGVVSGILSACDQIIPVWLGDRALNLAFIACNISILAGVWVALRLRSRMVWFYLASWLPVLVIFNLRIARNFGLVPQTDAIDFGSFISLGFEAVLLSVAIADRVRLLSRQFAAAEQERNALRSEASSDALTLVRNRAYFQRRLASIEAVGEPVDLVLVDIDYLKDTNDFAGHDAGDQLLLAAASRLEAAAACDDCVARVGGDEFAVLLAGDQRERLGAVLDSIRQVDSITLANGQVLPLSMSGGHSAWEPEQGFPGRLFKEADLALYKAKGSGRGAWRTYDHAMRDEEEARRRMILEARTALIRGEFFLAFQPIFVLNPNALLANEVLLRWRHPVHGVLTPPQFAAVLEEPALLTQLQDLVLDKALDAVGADPALKRVSVNFVASQLQGIASAERIFEKMASRGLPAERLIVEVRESVMLGRVAPGSPIEQCLERLRWAGVTIALDDFGTGGASLVHLRTLPTDILKIDVTLIAAISGDKATARTVNSLIDLAHGFGRTVIAEGIETEQQLSALKRAGCDAGQGHLLGRPVEGAGIGQLSIAAA